MKTPDKQLTSILEEGKNQLSRLSGRKKLAFLLKLEKTVKQQSSQSAEKLIDENLSLIEANPSEESAILLGEKTFLCFQRADIPEAERFGNKALSCARQVGSTTAEAKALTLRGYIDDVKGQHKKVVTWYMMALEKCSKLQKSGILLELGTSLSKQGEYESSRRYIKEAIKSTASLIKDKSLSKEDKFNQIRIQAETWSRFGTLMENIGDIDGATKAYDQAIVLTSKNNFRWEYYKVLSRKLNLFLIVRDFDGAKVCLQTIKSLSLDGLDPRAALFIPNDSARYYRAIGQYEEAMKEYKNVLYRDDEDEKSRKVRLQRLMEHQADLFEGILSGVYECLHALEQTRLAERFGMAMNEYEKVISDSGIYKEMDKNTKLQIRVKILNGLLEEVFISQPNIVRYRNIVATHITGRKKAKVRIGESKEIPLNIPSFYMFKLFRDHINECVTRVEIEKFWEDNDINLGTPDQRYVRIYLDRDLRKRLQLDQFIETCPKPKGGWRLLPEI